MTTQPDSAVGKGEPSALAGAAHKVLLFYFGVLASTIEESYALAHRLAEHGEAAEQEGRKRVSAIMERRKQDARQLEDRSGRRVEAVIDRLAPLSRADLAVLDEQIARLSSQIDNLQAF